ncbi:bifunctional phosphopantothenoylcysteine decarboxylase/phosphopantothenate--cysteine ligase CoaBC [Afipia sp. 1NLS2]|uniref:bifunctional phosphopantothenoylcysteine decarboxylase/phosphopantothenate--cysteine ligase CoaBC n=1 Tax=Afipia sp. 1NLS2 TaxID=666684 RepID=UPI0001DA1816|nr:bifunctional phosphopantothenoylcysteine decarboxylase/phosphopantothenate--cysteine ligase CoaBC [Afipia sp. 1NLS2]EFI53691.1 phosphopantothenoylcysteine decarboxylase/phosphopantothenate/cysteine ligase [Afipia sp. 1NLS2]
MASLTVRKLDDDIKTALKLRAAQSGRSVEDEVRVILRQAAAQGEALPVRPNSSVLEVPHPEPGQARHRVTLIIGGGIAAYKALDLIRRLKERGCEVRCVLTRAAEKFVTALSASALANNRCYTDLFDAESEFDAGHIRLARHCDLVVVAPATADLMAKMAQGLADDLASAILLATSKPVLLAPAMNPAMWNNAATQRNVAQLVRDGRILIGPNRGEMAEANEAGLGRMAEPVEIATRALALLQPAHPPILQGRRVLITAGPTHEPIDPVRYIANRSSGKQGYAIAAAAAEAGAEVVLVSGPVNLPDPQGVKTIRVEAARDMLAEVERALPADIAIFAAAVADWRVANAGAEKIKKTAHGMPPLEMVENPDILATVAKRTSNRPPLVIGFAAETEHVAENAAAKLARKGCDWIVANDVSPATGIMGGDSNAVQIFMKDRAAPESWPAMSKDDVATRLIARIADTFSPTESIARP